MLEPSTPPVEAKIAAVLETYPAWARDKALAVRELVFEVAHDNPDISQLEETLKWGEPAYLAKPGKIGSTVRMAWSSKRDKQLGLYFNCQTSLVGTFRTLFPQLRYEANRAIILAPDDVLPKAPLAVCIEAALTYHQWKKKGFARDTDLPAG